MKTYDSVVFGNYLVSLAASRGKILNMTKLQKIMFIIYGYYLTKEHKIISENPQAWPFGPVFPRIHKKVDYTKLVDLDDPSFDEIKEDVELVSLVERIIDAYAIYSATQLSNWSHMKGSPWDKTKNLDDFKWSKEIPDQYISEYFAETQIA